MLYGLSRESAPGGQMHSVSTWYRNTVMLIKKDIIVAKQYFLSIYIAGTASKRCKNCSVWGSSALISGGVYDLLLVLELSY